MLGASKYFGTNYCIDYKMGCLHRLNWVQCSNFKAKLQYNIFQRNGL